MCPAKTSIYLSIVDGRYRKIHTDNIKQTEGRLLGKSARTFITYHKLIMYFE